MTQDETTTTPLAEALGEGGAVVREGTPADAVCGRVPRFVARPPDTAAAQALLAAADRLDLATVVRGNGTASDWGAPPRRCDLLLETTALSGVEHAAGDLVVQAGAGTPLADLQADLAAAGQRLTLDPLVAGGTVGGAVATGLSGPRRLLHGPLRDLIIGMTAVRADGVAASSGGRVVKNVAGYDLGKLHTGALGTLGLITSATFRLHPLPEALRTIGATAADPETAQRWTHAVLGSGAVPAAVELDWPADGPLSVRVLLEGAEGGIDARARTVADVMDGADVAAGPPTGWGVLPGGADDTLLKIAVPIGHVAAAARLVREAARRQGVDAAVGGSAGAGVLFAALPASADAEPVGAVAAAVRSAVEGAVTVARTSPALAGADLDRWGAVPGLELMRAVKVRFDPRGLLAPGRFAGGI
ncbi:FAD-binding oxidoreductase [Streptomonospora wellingtoniae]|uniref:FAD-binding oxidoreductase n=1 Tax=Streptomonospora wellingtoniae TaxID=3075544 RepID=A0ABU2KSP1_9ACTN|nr:FAD-binding oxidoreductase [Streptomonospora sp. DSM 45055]MDT0302143.1 FAD-binding oxidoreductase [Streptomonospora sp. DSM 45055]